MIKNIKETFRLVKVNWRTLVVTELLYKLIMAVVFIPGLRNSMFTAMRLGGYSYLTRENAVSYITQPVTILILLGFFILAVYFVTINASAVIYIIDCSKQDKKIGLSKVIPFSLKNGLRAWKPKNLLILLEVIFFMPFLGVGMISAVLGTTSFPKFLEEHIEGTNKFFYPTIALAVIMFLFMIRWLYVFHYFTLEQTSFFEGRRKCINLSRKRHAKDIGTLILTEIIYVAVYLGFFFLATILAVYISRAVSNALVLGWVSGSVIWFVIIIFIFLAFALQTPVVFGCISAMFYSHKEEDGEEIKHIVVAEETEETEEKHISEKRERRYKAVSTIIIAVAALVLGIYTTMGSLNPQMEYGRTTEVTAHRGASDHFPECTMAAIRGADEMGADWVEIDVHLTKDEQVVILHDDNLLRTTGVNANIWQLTYDEVSRLDAGSFFSPRYAGEHIPLLTEAVEYADESGLKLNIELKPSGPVKGLEERVVDIIRQYDFLDQCVVTCQVYNSLEKVKAYDPEIVTAYVISFAYGNIADMDAADIFSIESKSATRRMVSTVHSYGKKVFVWTVNSEKNIDKMLDRNVDNIITDDLELARRCVDDYRYSVFFTRFMKLLK
ncbi:MAG: glycerophosphoryl diester phosphodiesterase membrane domain-containing protein [Firmicutes bacterium]|nr:glycerophosphoryl diester phosphodiesterase membrane domain-containing protein [Bacillota bacterium]